MTAIRVLLVDDHPIVRAGLRATLETCADIEIVGEATAGEPGVDQARDLRPDVVLMDLNLGAGIDGAEATRRLRALPDPPTVLVLTTYDSDADILRAIEAGATGYLLKDAEPTDLITAIRGGAQGETVLAPKVATRLFSRVHSPGRALTPRETEVLRMVAGGASNQGISRELFISEATVKSHLVQVFSKLGVDSRTAAVAQARRRGIIR